MKKHFKIMLLLVLVGTVVVLPKCVSAKEYSYGDFYNKKLLIFNGDKIITNKKHEYDCGFGRVCITCDGERFSLDKVTYNSKDYDLIYSYNYSLLLGENYVFDYRKFVDAVTINGGVELTYQYSEEDEQLVNSLLKDNSRVPIVTSCHTYESSYNCFYGHELCLNFDTKITLNLDYLNVSDTSYDNPVSYKKEDGTIVLKDLQRDDYEFDGWYLDSDFKYRVTELSGEFASNYFNDFGDFKNINKVPVRNENGNLIGKVNLYAKWIPNKTTPNTSIPVISNIVSNPKTLAPIGIVIGVLLTVGVVTGVIFFRKKKNGKKYNNSI